MGIYKYLFNTKIKVSSHSFSIFLVFIIAFYLVTITSCSGCRNPKNKVASNNSSKQPTLISFSNGIGNTSTCSLISGNTNNIDRMYVQVKSAVLKQGGNASNISDWEIVNIGPQKIFANNPVTGQEQLNNDGTITLDLPVEGFMALEINAVLSCHECCGNGSPTIFNCSPDILGKPLFTGNLQPTALKNVSGNKLSIPLSFKLCMCECR